MARVIWRSLFDSLRSDIEVFDDFLEVLSLALYGPSAVSYTHLRQQLSLKPSEPASKPAAK